MVEEHERQRWVMVAVLSVVAKRNTDVRHSIIWSILSHSGLMSHRSREQLDKKEITR
jgi:hypothetical protein